MYKYDCFLSYSSADRRQAQQLQNFLESYRSPVLERTLKVFRDTTDMVARGIWTELDEALKSSRILVVCVSENSAKSNYIREEIAKFSSFHESPVILVALIGGNPRFIPEQLNSQKYVDLRHLNIFTQFRATTRQELLRLFAALSGDTLRTLIPWDKLRVRNRLLMIWTPIILIISILSIVTYNEKIAHQQAEFSKLIALAKASSESFENIPTTLTYLNKALLINKDLGFQKLASTLSATLKPLDTIVDFSNQIQAINWRGRSYLVRVKDKHISAIELPFANIEAAAYTRDNERLYFSILGGTLYIVEKDGSSWNMQVFSSPASAESGYYGEESISAICPNPDSEEQLLIYGWERQGQAAGNVDRIAISLNLPERKIIAKTIIEDQFEPDSSRCKDFALEVTDLTFPEFKAISTAWTIDKRTNHSPIPSSADEVFSDESIEIIDCGETEVLILPSSMGAQWSSLSAYRIKKGSVSRVLQGSTEDILPGGIRVNGGGDLNNLILNRSCSIGISQWDLSVYDMMTGREIFKLPEAGIPTGLTAESVAVSPDATYIAVKFNNAEIYVYKGTENVWKKVGIFIAATPIHTDVEALSVTNSGFIFVVGSNPRVQVFNPSGKLFWSKMILDKNLERFIVEESSDYFVLWSSTALLLIDKHFGYSITPTFVATDFCNHETDFKLEAVYLSSKLIETQCGQWQGHFTLPAVSLSDESTRDTLELTGLLLSDEGLKYALPISGDHGS